MDFKDFIETKIGSEIPQNDFESQHDYWCNLYYEDWIESDCPGGFAGLLNFIENFEREL